MIRKIIAWPFGFVGRLIAVVGILIALISGLIKGKSIKEINSRLSTLGLGIECAENKKDSIIELVEVHYGSGKAMRVSEILNESE